MAVFYQKYRPQTFADVVGQEAIVQTLQNAAESGQLAHAYLFTGSRGVGKTTLARILAKAANCQNSKNGAPCGKCDICTSIANGSSLDIIEIDAASHTGVDNVREFIEHAQFKPAQMSKKVFIIDEVHMLSKAAFNALLKTLEEPPEHAMFILATTDIEKVPATIISRTQRFDFKRISELKMTEALEVITKDQKLKLPDGTIQAVVQQSEGSMRDALTRLDMVASLAASKGKISLEDIEQLLGASSLVTVQELIGLILARDSASLPDFFEVALSKGADPSVFSRTILIYLRKLLNAKLTEKIDGDEIFASQVNTFALAHLLFVIRLFLRAYKELSFTPSPELPLLLASIEASMYGQGSAGVATAQVVAPIAAPASQPQVKTSEQKAEQKPVQRTKIIPEIQEKPKELYTTLTMEELNQWWPDVISRVKTENSPVATLLKNSPVVEVENGRITVAVKYLFHKEHLDNKKHAVLITDTITAVSGKNLMFKAVIQTNTREPVLAQTVDALSDALKVFGGELVE